MGGGLRVPSRQETNRVPKTEPIKGLLIAKSCPSHRIPQTGSFPTKADKKGKKAATKADKKGKKAAREWKPDCSRIQTAGIHQLLELKAWIKCYKDTTAKDTN